MCAPGTASASSLHGLTKRQVTACSMMRPVCAICSCSSTTCLLLMQYSCTACLLPMHWRMVKAWLVMNERTNERTNERMHDWQSGRT